MVTATDRNETHNACFDDFRLKGPVICHFMPIDAPEYNILGLRKNQFNKQTTHNNANRRISIININSLLLSCNIRKHMVVYG